MHYFENMSALTNTPFLKKNKLFEVGCFKHVLDQDMDERSRYVSSPLLQDTKSNLTLRMTCNIEDRERPGAVCQF